MLIQSLILFPLAFAAQEGAKPAAPATKTAHADDEHTAADAAVKTIDEFIAGKGQRPDGAQWKLKLKMPPTATFDPESDYFWNLETSKGPVTIKLMPDVAPIHVSSTMYLSRVGFYDNTKFHRVIKNFMAQGGCPSGNGFGGPGYTYDGEYDPKVVHDRPGLLSMANTGRPKSDGSQFFLTFVPTPHLDGKHTIFGEVVGDGMKTVKALEASGSQSGKTSEPLLLKKSWITVKPKEKAGG